MIYELLYTSVPKGLKPGAKGYCTVLTTEGIPSALLERLESYCGYRHLFDPDSPDNPEAFGHRVLNLAGNTWHILSRVADAGFDYSGRSNLIGHFMAISQDELKGISAGPTSLMMSPGLFRKELVGGPRRVSEAETSKRLVGVMDRPQKAVTWNMVAGDAGWAGKLVQTTEESNESVSLIYPLRTNTLKLLDEAASILPKNKQWDITFNTFFTKSGEECRWRCYCANVPEAVPFKGSEFDLVDVKRKGLDPGDGVYVGAAREGKKMAGDVAKAGPALSNNAKLNTGKSVEAGKKLANIRKVKQEVELVKQEEVEFISVVKKSIDVLPRKTGSVPPPVQREEHFDLLEEDLADVRKTVYRKQQSENPYKTALMISVPVLLCIILLLIFMGIFVNLSSQSKPKSDLVVLEKTNSKKDSDVSTDIKPILTKGMPQDNSLLNPIDDPIEAQAKIEAEKKKSIEAQAKIEAEKKKSIEAQAKIEAEKKKSIEAQAKIEAEVNKKKNAPTELVATRDIDGNLVVGLDLHLKNIATNLEKFEDVKVKGVRVNLPEGLELSDVLVVKRLDESTKNILKIIEIKSNGFRVMLPEELKVQQIEEATFAITKISRPSALTIQFFTPIHLKYKSLKNSPKTGLSETDEIQFITENESNKKQLISKFCIEQNSHINRERVFSSSHPDYTILDNSRQVGVIAKDLMRSKSNSYHLFVRPKPSEKKPSDPKELVMRFNSYTCYIPLVFNERNKVWGDIDRLEQIVLHRPNLHDVVLQIKTLKSFVESFPETNEYLFKPLILPEDSEKPELNTAELYKILADLKMEFKGGGSNLIRTMEKFDKEIVKYILPIKMGKNEVLDGYIAQINQMQKFINESPPDFNVYYNLLYKSDTDDNPGIDMSSNKEFFKDTKILIYKFKSDLNHSTGKK